MSASTTSARILVERLLVAVADGGFSRRSSTYVGRHLCRVKALWMM
jgi:hypothetical protein